VGSNADIRATDRFAFVRDGFHLWAAILGVVWLAWHRLWLALLGWIVLMTVIDVAMVRFGLAGTAVFAVDALLALLLGFEAASLQRWTLSRRKWRQLDIVVADDEEAAERRFFDRWTAKQRALSNDQSAVDRGAPPPTRDVPGQAFSRPPPVPPGDIIGLFPEPGGSR
jgi:type VI protein secretion system component VasK